MYLIIGKLEIFFCSRYSNTADFALIAIKSILRDRCIAVESTDTEFKVVIVVEYSVVDIDTVIKQFSVHEIDSRQVNGQTSSLICFKSVVI